MQKGVLALTPGRYVVAVSGGVDSVALLHMMAGDSQCELIVAHFDHGIRSDSASDAEFVRTLTDSYGLTFEASREELGPGASEDLARSRRYNFLYSVAKRHNAKIVTAHHADDVVETVSINLHRGTGWRGLAVLDSPKIVRPLLGIFKDEIIHYAKSHNLEWREDSTNTEEVYLRNRIRSRMNLTTSQKLEILALRSRQVELKRLISDELDNHIRDDMTYERYFFINTDYDVALEILKVITGSQLTYPQLERALIAIKTARPGTTHQAHKTVEFRFTPRHFVVQLIK